ncbi:MAG: riboflavin synthase [Legionellales bacterium]|nr:riboflavin synthase [Legionellales bacterium]
MFTGLIETKGKILSNVSAGSAHRLLIETPFVELQVGESISVNGVCLTLLVDDTCRLAFDVSPETLQLTTLGELSVGDEVNLERAMSSTSRFGGHYVSGHVDTTALVTSIASKGEFLLIKVGGFLRSHQPYLLSKGSITLDGVSLTMNEVVDGCVHVMLVPHTLQVTTLAQWREGRRINVEFDYIARIVAHQLKSSANV